MGYATITELLLLIEKRKISDEELICKIRLVLAYANTVKGNFITSFEVLQSIVGQYGLEFANLNTINADRCEIMGTYSLIDIINRFFIKDYEDLQESLFASVEFANDTGDNFTKHFVNK